MTNSQPVATPSVLPHFPWGTLLLSTATVVLSAFVAIEISGTWMGKVRIVDLEQYGVRFEHVQKLELWRLVTAQLVHVKQLHMVSDVFCLLWVGTAIEKHVGGVRLLLLWLIGGSLATLFSTLFVAPPWNLGTGASQAVMAIAGTGLWLAIEGVDRSRSLMWPVAFSIGLAFAIDIVHVYHPKPGHVAGLLLGLLAAMLHKRKAETSP
ncbi:MAG TPA: rhomboid family intramembrane serine protease [Aquimonas sp.]|jgi:rhomboid protease GluP|nr:rhomboid family intramembrane serine protease [Xanthomonadales bacterium]HRF54107.1 rhomboid family intramembrane serine protease [Aquimonas sp.]